MEKSQAPKNGSWKEKLLGAVNSTMPWRLCQVSHIQSKFEPHNKEKAENFSAQDKAGIPSEKEVCEAREKG